MKDVYVKLLSYVENTEAFLVKETPLYIQQLLEYEAMSNIMDMIIPIGVGAGLSICFILFIKFILKKEKDDKICFDDVFGAFSVSGVVYVFIMSICLASSLNRAKNLYKIKYAPKVFIVEHLKEQIK